MKEIIYLDTDIMNSMLAQLDKGVIFSFSLEEETQESESESHQKSRGKNASLGGGLKVNSGFLPGGEINIQSKLDNNGNEQQSEARTILESQKDILNKAFHDYALDILQKKLIEEKLIQQGPKFNEGDLHLGADTFRFFDFNLMKNVIDHKQLREIMMFVEGSPISEITEAMEILERKKKGKLTKRDQSKVEFASMLEDKYEDYLPTINLFKVLEAFNTYSDKAFSDSAIIKIGNKIGFLKKKYLRDSSAALSFRTDKSRNVKFLVRIIGVKETVYNEENMPELSMDEIDLIPNLIFDVLLGSFGIIKPNDVLVTPIAIYYE